MTTQSPDYTPQTIGNVSARLFETTGQEASKDWPDGSRTWRVELRFYARRMTTTYHTGSAIEPHKITTADVLESLFMDSDSYENAQDFDDFASEFGYDSDSIKARDIYKACQRIHDKLHQFLGDQYDALRARVNEQQGN